MIEVEVEDESWRGVVDVGRAVTRAAEAALSSSFEASSCSALPPREGEGIVTLLLTDDETVRELNARFRGKDAPTNVLSFPTPASARPHLGDIALAFGVCAREATEQGKTLAEHLSHLVAHGVLHLLSYDHETDADAAVMEAMERDILGRLGIADPYRLDLADAGP